MAAVRSADTGPELSLRRALYATGLRGWRCHYKRAPGKPDLAWPARRVAVFVDGAFWHGHSSRHRPGRSGAYWDEKIARNVERDREVDAALEAAGWTVVRVWDFEVVRELAGVVERVMRAVEEANIGNARNGRFAQNLRRARLAAELTQEELSQRAGVSRAQIALYEQGRREPAPPTLAKLARGLGSTGTSFCL